jgi:peptidoglycan-associated lipoprotein
VKHLRTWALLAGSVVFLAACSSTPPVAMAPAKTPPAPTPAPMTPAPMNTSSVMAPKVEAMSLPAYLDPQNAISTQRSVYFDYDIFAVKPEFARMLEMHGKFLAANPKVSIRVQGNADERGSAEYNLALGQKRADAVLRALKIYGVKDSQMESISFGREKPKAMGHDEAAWSQNRRVDLEYPSK